MNPSRQRGRPAKEIDELRSVSIRVHFSPKDLEFVRVRAAVAGRSVADYARKILLVERVVARRPDELLRLWSTSSTLQSNANQLVARLDELRMAGELNLRQSSATLEQLLIVAPQLLDAVHKFRAELGAR